MLRSWREAAKQLVLSQPGEGNPTEGDTQKGAKGQGDCIREEIFRVNATERAGTSCAVCTPIAGAVPKMEGDSDWGKPLSRALSAEMKSQQSIVDAAMRRISAFYPAGAIASFTGEQQLRMIEINNAFDEAIIRGDPAIEQRAAEWEQAWRDLLDDNPPLVGTPDSVAVSF